MPAGPAEKGDEGPAVNPIWGEDWSDVRDLFVLDRKSIHLNHGSFGAVPRPVLEAQRAIRMEEESNPTDWFWRRFHDRREAARLEAARFVGADPSGLVFVPNATSAANAVFSSFPLRSGDEVLVSGRGYGALRMAAARACRTAGARLVVSASEIPRSKEQAVESYLSAVSEKTRLAVVDQIESPTGLVLPAEHIVSALRRSGIAVMVDGAHAPGQIPVDVDRLGADFWICNFHKWVCAPRGAAALWVSERWRSTLGPLVVSWPFGEGFPANFAWAGTDDYSAWLAVPAALRFMQDLGWQRVREHNHALALIARERLEADLAPTGIPGEMFGSMSLVRLPDGWVTDRESAEALSAWFWDEVRAEVAVVELAGAGYIRLSAQVYNHPGEYEVIARALARKGSSDG